MPDASNRPILNVDDEEVARYTKTRILRHAGFEVLEAATGKAALDIVAQRAPALVLLDVRLPDISGTDVCKIVKQRWPMTMVLQTSATFVTAADRVRGLDGGADSYLAQPVDPDELVAAVRALLRLHTAEESLRSLNDSLELRIAQRTADLRLANDRLVEQMAQREVAEAALVQAQKIEAVGQLTGVMAHDFNNVLAALQGYLHLLQRKRSDEQAVLALTDNALKVVRRGAKLTARVLSFARPQTARNEAVDVRALLRDMEDWLIQSTGKSVVLRVNGEGPPMIAVTDTNQLELAILNLVINSRDAMPEGGRIEIDVATKQSKISSDGLPPGEYVVVSISDNGSGMTDDVASRVFEPFYTTKPAGRGTGLGLAQVHQLARQSNGTVRLQTKVGAGTTVSLWLPAGTPDMIQSPIMSAQSRATSNILLVDDDNDVRVTVAAYLSDHGYSVRSAADGIEAIRMIEQERPDALILDVAMPGMTGIEVARTARTIHRALPILFLSGNADSVPTGGELAGARFVRKPFDPVLLLQSLAASLQPEVSPQPPQQPPQQSPQEAP
jgi:DNA-binding response OmpR family regulator